MRTIEKPEALTISEESSTIASLHQQELLLLLLLLLLDCKAITNATEPTAIATAIARLITLIEAAPTHRSSVPQKHHLSSRKEATTAALAIAPHSSSAANPSQQNSHSPRLLPLLPSDREHNNKCAWLAKQAIKAPRSHIDDALIAQTPNHTPHNLWRSTLISFCVR